MPFFFFNIIARPSSSTYRSRKRLFPVSGLQNAGPYIVEEGSKEKMEKENLVPFVLLCDHPAPKKMQTFQLYL